ncbi:DUF397 domain-containing protein [Streptomyces sp. NRRL F-5126]|uniref:DUF397 domain-containing protein n=1 Tax=Streptomyces sp. NRRL F-5126 TaxID=1463857 RepID=UPI00099D0BE4|nr:DUF397 domain-containing protein [Streptomyces sp. NRRL F-5126]
MNTTASDVRCEAWVKSSYSNGNGGNCLEWAPALAAASGAVPVRDSKSLSAGVLVFPAGSWDVFVTAAARGRFSRIVSVAA